MPVTRTRLAPAARKEQLLALGARMVQEGRLDDVSIDAIAEQAGISRGLLYHYFPNKREFRLAVLRQMAEEVISLTAPPEGDQPLEQLYAGLAAYVDYVTEHHAAYVSFARGAAGGDEDFREIHDQARTALTDRIFSTTNPAALAELGLADTPAVRLMVRGWSALVEDMVLTWLEDDRGITRGELLTMMTAALGGLGAVVSTTR